MSDEHELRLDVLGPALRDAIEQLVDERVEQQLATTTDGHADMWPEWMSVETAARYLDVSEERVRKLKDRRAIPYYQEGRGCRLFLRRSELDAWLDAQREGRVR